MEAVDETNPVRLLKIEEELAGPDAEEAMCRYDAQLAAVDDRLRMALARGLAPDEYARAEELQGAVEVARKILRLTVRK